MEPQSPICVKQMTMIVCPDEEIYEEHLKAERREWGREHTDWQRGEGLAHWGAVRWVKEEKENPNVCQPAADWVDREKHGKKKNSKRNHKRRKTGVITNAVSAGLEGDRQRRETRTLRGTSARLWCFCFFLCTGFNCTFSSVYLCVWEGKDDIEMSSWRSVVVSS